MKIFANGIVGLGLAWAGLAVGDELPQGAGPAELQTALASAQWPADILQLADACLTRFPGSDCARTAPAIKQRAAATNHLLGLKEVRLQRSAFVAANLPLEWQDEIHQAALGDGAAALRIAHAYRPGAGSVLPANPYRYVGWLQYAALLGEDAAAYELAVHFRTEGEPAIAAIYESRALAMGFTPPLALDHNRK